MKSMTSLIVNFIVFIVLAIGIIYLIFKSIHLFPKTPQGMFAFVGFILGVMMIGFFFTWLVRISSR